MKKAPKELQVSSLFGVKRLGNADLTLVQYGMAAAEPADATKCRKPKAKQYKNHCAPDREMSGAQ